MGAGNTPADRTRRCAFVAREAPHADDTAGWTAVRPHTQGNPLEGTPNGPIAERPELLGIGAGFIGRQVSGPIVTRAGIDACGIVAVAAIDGGRRRAARQTIGPAGCCNSFRRATGGRRSTGSAGTSATAIAGGRRHGPADLALTARDSHAHRSAPCVADNSSPARTTWGCGCPS